MSIGFVAPKPPFPVLSWRGGFHPVFLFLCAALLAVNWFVPADWIEHNPQAMEFAELVRNQLLRISPYADIWAHARTTFFPKAALFSHALLWVFAALVTCYNILAVALNWRIWAHHFKTKLWPALPRKYRVAFYASPVLVLVVFWVATMMPGNLQHMASADLTSRAFFGFLSACGLTAWHGMVFGITIMLFSLFADIFDKDQS